MASKLKRLEVGPPAPKVIRGSAAASGSTANTGRAIQSQRSHLGSRCASRAR